MATNQVPGWVTQRVSLDEVEAVLPPHARAAVAFSGDGPECVPVMARRDGAFRIGLHPDELPNTGVPQRVVLVVDDGRYWFELRAPVWRGTVTAEHGERASSSADDGLVWLRFEPLRVAAWDYGQLREEPGG